MIPVNTFFALSPILLILAAPATSDCRPPPAASPAGQPALPPPDPCPEPRPVPECQTIVGGWAGLGKRIRLCVPEAHPVDAWGPCTARVLGGETLPYDDPWALGEAEARPELVRTPTAIECLGPGGEVAATLLYAPRLEPPGLPQED